MEWNYNLPEVPGKYVVQTRTSMGNTNTMEADFWLDEEDRPKWSFNRQIFYRYLAEEEGIIITQILK